MKGKMGKPVRNSEHGKRLVDRSHLTTVDDNRHPQPKKNGIGHALTQADV
jgi:hypothetical protein